MIDAYNRNIDYIRISVTDRCDLRCVYCMPEDGIAVVTHEDILRYDEITRLARNLVSLGIKKIKLTGGEPLCRLGITNLVASLKDINGIEQVTLTTNAVGLKQKYDSLVSAGIDGINISLDTLDRDLYREITRFDMLPEVLSAIDHVLASGSAGVPVKINCVPLNRRQKLTDIALFAKDNDIAVRFIELMPIGYGKYFEYISRQEVMAKLEQSFGTLTPYEGKPLGNGPAEYYTAEGFVGKIGFISAVSHKFCENCNRIRLTSEGHLKTCLQYDFGTDIRKLLRNGSSDEDIREAIKLAVAKKPSGHHFGEVGKNTDEKKTMSQIGG